MLTMNKVIVKSHNGFTFFIHRNHCVVDWFLQGPLPFGAYADTYPTNRST
jgi:hypothetical protein